MFHVAPLLLLALLVWIERGLPRPPWLTAVAAVFPPCCCSPCPWEPAEHLVFSDTFGFMPLFRVQNFFNGDVDRVRWLMIAGGIGLPSCSSSSHVGRPLSAVGVGIFLILSSWAAYGAVKDISQGMANGTFGGSRPAGSTTRLGLRQVARVFGPSTDFARATLLWQTEFWNRSVAHVYNLGVPEPAGGLAERREPWTLPEDASPWGAADERYVVVESDLVSMRSCSHNTDNSLSTDCGLRSRWQIW